MHLSMHQAAQLYLLVLASHGTTKVAINGSKITTHNTNMPLSTRAGIYTSLDRNNQSSASLYQLRDEYNRSLKAVDAKTNNHSYTGVGELLNNNLPYWARYYKVYVPNNIIMRHNLENRKNYNTRAYIFRKHSTDST